MELRSRSRSITPFQTENFIEAESFEGDSHVTVTRSTRRTTTLRSMASGGSSSEEFYTAVKPIKTKSTKLSRRVTSAYKTSDYSSEEGETESGLHISENEKNQIIEDAKAAANGTAEVSALNLYRKAGRYWDKYPKTDYTYSRHSRDRVEIAPGVVQMPNMSRRTIHLYDSSTNTDSYIEKAATRMEHVNKKLFTSMNNNQDEVDESFRIIRASSSSRRTFATVITSVFVSIYTVIFWCFHSVYQVSNSTTISLMKKLHHLSSRVMLLDTWLLKKSIGGKRTRAVVALCLLPLLLFGAWFLLSSLGNAIYWSLFSPSDKTIVLPAVTDTQPLYLGNDEIFSPKSGLSPDMQSDTNLNNFNNLDTDEIVEKFLQNPKIYNILNNYQSNINIEQSAIEREQKLLTLINDLRGEINNIKQDFIDQEKTKNDNFNRILSQIRTENVRNVAQLTQRLNRCCNKPMVDLEPYITRSLSAFLNDPKFLSNQRGLTNWLHTLFIAKQELEESLSNLTHILTMDFDKSIESTADRVMEKVITKLTDHRFDASSITDEQIKKIVKSALEIYDADKTGLVDYAMEPIGGQVVTTRCTESYHAGTAVISVLGIPLWYPTMSPRIVIVPGINPGECWAFQNFPGFIVIKLANRINVEAFSLEHVSRLLVPDGKIDSAPKEFEVYGLNSENEKEPIKIGEYVYDYDGDSVQYFTAHNPGVFSMVEVRIKSNHGNPNYTCLYRFRVHGTLSSEPT